MKFEGLKYPPPENQQVTGVRMQAMFDLGLFMSVLDNGVISPKFFFLANKGVFKHGFEPKQTAKTDRLRLGHR